MTEQDRRDAEDRALWLAARRSWAVRAPGEKPGFATIAAYLDDRLEAAERARVEAWMVAAPEVLDLAAAARAAAQAGSAPAPESVVARARAARPERAAKGFRLAGWLSEAVRPLRLAALGGAAAAVILAAITGFELGRAGYGEIAALDSLLTEDLEIGFDQDDLI